MDKKRAKRKTENQDYGRFCMTVSPDYRQMKEKSFATIEGLRDFIETVRDANTCDETKFSREWWTIAAYAHFHALAKRYSFPLIARRGDEPKPDFWIRSDGSSDEKGLETTFCCEEKYEQAKKICRKRGDGSYPINTSFMKDKVNHFNDTSIQYREQPLHGMPTYGNYSTTYATNKISNSINEKVTKYDTLRGHFGLVVYVNLFSNIYIDEDDKEAICHALSGRSRWSRTYSSIEILWSKEDVRSV